MSDPTVSLGRETKTEAPSHDFISLKGGQRVGRYEILAVLGQGGFGITYRARDSELGREVAIKEYLPAALALRQDGSSVMPRSTHVADDFLWGRERFVEEGRTLASLHHAPAIVRVFDFLQINGTAYIVMELVQGETLEHRLRRGTLTPAELDAILPPLLDGLETVHAAGFLHRDIKPANILLKADGQPTLIDFGASRAAMAGRTTAMTAIFTPGYAAAEQFTSAKQGPWTDIYGLAATVHCAITGTAPPSAFDRMLDDTYQPLGQAPLPGFAPSLLTGIDAGLGLRAAERPQTIAEWRAMLGGDLSAAVTVAMPRRRPSPPPPATSQRSRPLLWVGATLAVLLLAAVGGYFAVGPERLALMAKPAQSLTAEELEQALAERRKADQLAAEKKKLEEEAQRNAAAEAETKRQADADLATARERRQKAEKELADLKAGIEARQKAEAAERERAATDARRAETETEAQRKAEAEIAALRRTEEEAQKKAAAEAEAKRQADEALARAQVERQKAEEEAQKKTEAETKAKAEADAKVKAEAEKKAAEAAEAGLRLSTVDRQRLQVALTAVGFDTRGSDGALGPRSREMIAAWQKARNLPATGFVDAGQQRALLQAAAAAIAKFDEDQKKAEDDKKKAEEEAKKKAEEAKKKAEEEAKAKAATPIPAPALAPPPAPAPTPAPPAQAGGGFDGTWTGTAGVWSITMAVAGQKAHITLSSSCIGGSIETDVAINKEGGFWAEIRGGGLARRSVSGTLPTFNITGSTPGGAYCPAGSTTLSR